MSDWFIRTPASSANLGAGFDVLGMALSLHADVGLGTAPDSAQQVDQHHPSRIAFEALGGRGPIWIRCNIPMGRGLGFSGAARVGAAALAVAQRGAPVESHVDEILQVTKRLEGHGDNVAASLFGGVTAYVEGEAIRVPVGPTMAAAAFVAWVPDTTTSTETSRRSLGDDVTRRDAVHNIGRSIQFVMAFVYDDETMLAGGSVDRLHQDARLVGLPDGEAALDAGVEAGAWAGWLSGSGPTVGFLCPAADASQIVAALPPSGHGKVLSIDTVGCRLESPVTTT